MDTNTIFSWYGFTVFQEPHWQRHLRLLWNTATCEGSTPACYSSPSHRHPIPFPPLFSLSWTRGGSAAWARPSAPATHYLLLPPPYSLPYRRARARQPRTPPSPILPTLYFGRPLQSVHALPSPLFSLLSTRNMHTRYSLCGFVLDGESLLLEEIFGQRQVLHVFGGQVDGIAVEVF